MAQAAIMPAIAPVERPPVGSNGIEVADADDVASLVGVTVAVITPASVCSSVCDAVADVWLVLALVAEEYIELDEEGSLPTAGGPSVEPLRSWAACLYCSGVLPVRPVMLKRGE